MVCILIQHIIDIKMNYHQNIIHQNYCQIIVYCIYNWIILVKILNKVLLLNMISNKRNSKRNESTRGITATQWRKPTLCRRKNAETWLQKASNGNSKRSISICSSTQLPGFSYFILINFWPGAWRPFQCAHCGKFWKWGHPGQYGICLQGRRCKTHCGSWS